jgi:pSer/pThr/pTyr-binding forkhead associated (FHA) protein
MPGTQDDSENAADLRTTQLFRAPEPGEMYGAGRPRERIIHGRGGDNQASSPPPPAADPDRLPTMPEPPQEVAGERARPWRPEHQLPVLSVTALRADGAPGQTFFIRDAAATCGREAGCEIQIANDPLLSKRHFELVRLEEEGEQFWEIRDLGSSGGLWIRVEEAWLYKSAEICLGNTRLLFMPEPPQAADTPPPARDVTGVINLGSLQGGSVLRRLPRDGIPGRDFTLKKLSRTHWVGRNPKQCTVVCEDDEFVDERHALVEYDDTRKRWRIRDQGSTNGLWIRRKSHRVSVERRELVVRAGEQVLAIKMDVHA